MLKRRKLREIHATANDAAEIPAKTVYVSTVKLVAALARVGDAAVAPLCDIIVSARDNEARLAATVDALSSLAADIDLRIMALAEHADPHVGLDAVQVLGRRRSTAAVPLLATLTAGADDNVAVGAIEALGRIGGRFAVAALVDAVRSGNFFRAFPAIDVLGRTEDPRAVEPLAALLSNPQYLHDAARALGHTLDRHAVEPLAKLLVHHSVVTVRVAGMALADLDARYCSRYGACTVIDDAVRESAPREASRSLVRCVAGAHVDEQAALCRLLGFLRDPTAVPTLTALLDSGPVVSAAAAAALAEVGDSAEGALAEALRASSSARRAACLPRVSVRRASTADVVACLDDPEGNVRALACEALARIGDPSAAPPLFAVLADPNPRVVQAAVAAIQSLGSAETERLTLLAAGAEDRAVRREALRIVGYFAYRSALPLLLSSLASTDERTRDGAIAALTLMDDTEARQALVAQAKSGAPRARACAMRAIGNAARFDGALEALRSGSADDDAWVRYYAVQALGKMRAIEATDELRAALDDPAPHVRIAAVEAFAHLDDSSAFDALVAAAGSAETDLRRAALLGFGLSARREAIPILLESTRSNDPATRLVAVSALARFDDDEVVPVLAARARDADEGVASTALTLLAVRTSLAATEALIGLLDIEPFEARIRQALSMASSGRLSGLLAALAVASALFI